MRKLDLKEFTQAIVTSSREFPLTALVAVLVVFTIAGKGQQQKADEITHTLCRCNHALWCSMSSSRIGAVRSKATSRRRIFTSLKMASSKRLFNFEIPSAHIIPTKNDLISSTADLDKRAPQSPVNIVVLDELNTTFQDMAFARFALKKYLDSQVGAVQAPTMLIAVSFDKFTVLHDYTQDRTAVLSALDHHLAAYPWNLQRGEGKVRTMVLSLGAIEQVAQATAGHPGHKNLIWVGKGFPGIDLVSPR
jgi:hypothetical protein